MNGYAHELSPRSTRTWPVVIQGYYHIIQTGEKREYGELHLWKLHYDYEIVPIVMENIIAKGQRHELPVLVQGTKRETAISSMKTTEMVQDTILSKDTLWQEDCDMDDSYNEVDHLDNVEEY
jgi:nitroimidazol reductase NimA-like FMN-containing flavoprotein (pyridoxamine 5'-phosphate oxidase superfamily)